MSLNRKMTEMTKMTKKLSIWRDDGVTVSLGPVTLGDESNFIFFLL